MKKSMIQRLGCLVASISFAFVGATAFADAWFDGGIENDATLQNATGGSWDIPASGGWDSAKKTYNNFNDPLTFTASPDATIPGEIASIKTTVKFTAKDELKNDEIAGAKGGLMVFENEDSTATNYYGVVNGAWAQLSGTPDLTKEVEVNISLSAVGNKRFITYTIDNEALTLENGTETKIETSFGNSPATINSVEFLGKATITSLTGEKKASKFDLTVPVVAGATATVKVNDVVAAAKSETVYEIPYGAKVEVTYAGTGVTVAGGTFTYNNFDGSVTAVETKDVKVTVSLTVPTVANTKVEVKVGNEKVDPPATGNDYTFAYDTKNVTVTYTPDENYKFTKGEGVFTYESLTANTTVDTTQFTVAEKTKYTVSFKTSLSDQPYYTKEVYEGAKLGDFTTPDAKTGYTGAWDTTPTADDVINANTTYTYTYTAINYAITVSVKDNVGGTASADQTTYNISDAAQTIELTATPSDGYKFSKWNFSKDGVSISGSTLTIAANTIGAIAIEAEFEEDKIVPIDPSQDPGLPKMDVNKEKFPGKTTEEIKTYLKTVQDNGQKGWVNYALGIGNTAADEPFLADKGTAGKVVIDLGNAGTAPTDSGVTSKIVRVVDGDNDVEIVDGEIVLNDDDTETATMKVALVLYDKENNPTKVVEKEVGVENTAVECDEGMDSVILSVPFTDMAEGSVSVANLIKAKNLEKGDRLSVYNASKGMNEGWNWSGEAWTADDGVGPAAEKFLKPGEGVWFTPADKTAKKHLFKFGAYSATKPAVEVTTGNWALIANPHLTCEAEGGVVALDNLIASPTVNDEFQVETATTPVIFTYDGDWGYNKVTEIEKTIRKVTTKVRQVQRCTEAYDIAPGKGLWYGNGNAEKKSVQW